MKKVIDTTFVCPEWADERLFVNDEAAPPPTFDIRKGDTFWRSIEDGTWYQCREGIYRRIAPDNRLAGWLPKNWSLSRTLRKPAMFFFFQYCQVNGIRLDFGTPPPTRYRLNGVTSVKTTFDSNEEAIKFADKHLDYSSDIRVEQILD